MARRARLVEITLPDLAATETLAASFARNARMGDCFALSGELGAGKTAFARAFIRALTGPDTEVPSPTFTLVQTYDAALADGTPALITHADLYRLKREEELEEIGLDDAFARGVTLIEWPEMAARLLPASHIALHFGHDGEARIVRCNGPEECYSALTLMNRAP